MGREIVCGACAIPRCVRIGDDPFDVAQRCAEIKRLTERLEVFVGALLALGAS